MEQQQIDSPASVSSDPAAAGNTKGRRFHSKSRHGCRGCKERRIKCDELRPVCSNCNRRETDCEYEKTLEELQNEASTKGFRIRKSRAKKDPSASIAKSFTFVDVSGPNALKRKRLPELSENLALNLALGKFQPETGDEEPTILEAVDRALANGKELARLLIVSKAPPPTLVGDFPDQSDISFPRSSKLEALENEASTTSRSRTRSPASPSTPRSQSQSSLSARSETQRWQQPLTMSEFNAAISMWQSSPSTSIRQAARGINIGMRDYNLIQTYRNMTCESFVFSGHSKIENPWRNITFDLAFENPHLYHTTLAVTSAHLRHMQSISTPTIQEVSHYIKGLSMFRQTLALRRSIIRPFSEINNPALPRPTPSSQEESIQICALFTTSVLLSVYHWAVPPEDIHTSLESSMSLMLGTREIIHGCWEDSSFQPFRTALGAQIGPLVNSINRDGSIGLIRFPAVEKIVPRHWRGIVDIYDVKNASITKETCQILSNRASVRPVYDTENADVLWDLIDDQLTGTSFSEDSGAGKEHQKRSDGSGGGSTAQNDKRPIIPVDSGSLHRLIYILTAVELESRQPMTSVSWNGLMRLSFMWPGICTEDLLIGIKSRDPRVYLLLAYYYAAILKMGSMSAPTLEIMLNQNGQEHLEPIVTSEELAKAWWLMKNPKKLVKGIVAWLGDEWKEDLAWVTQTVEEVEAKERDAMDSFWDPLEEHEF